MLRTYFATQSSATRWGKPHLTRNLTAQAAFGVWQADEHGYQARRLVRREPDEDDLPLAGEAGFIVAAYESALSDRQLIELLGSHVTAHVDLAQVQDLAPNRRPRPRHGALIHVQPVHDSIDRCHHDEVFQLRFG